MRVPMKASLSRLESVRLLSKNLCRSCVASK